MSTASILVATDARGVATLTLNRPERRNAFDDAMIAELRDACVALGADGRVRLVVLTGAGAAFSAGADIRWMQRMATYTEAENRADARRLAEMLRTLDDLPKPTIARVNGAAIAGGVGLVSCCDIAVAAADAVFAVAEVRVGLLPATIAPYLLRTIGPRAARRYFLTGESFPAEEAQRIGLVHEVVPAAVLDAAVERAILALLAGAPGAQGHAKRMIAAVAGRPVTEELIALTAQAIGDARASEEGREGLAAFLEKRRPRWRG